MTPLLATIGLQAFYGDFQALFGIDFEITEGEVVAIPIDGEISAPVQRAVQESGVLDRRLVRRGAAL